MRIVTKRGKLDLEAAITADETVLYIAGSKNHDILVDLLLKHDANVGAKPSGGESAISRVTFKSL